MTFKIGGKFDYTYESNDKIIVEQKRLNIINLRISIPLEKNRVDKKVEKKLDLNSIRR